MTRKTRYRFDWYGIVLNRIKRYPTIKNEVSMQSAIFTNAIERALQETLGKRDGEDICKAVDLLYFKKVGNLDIVADRLHVSRPTVQRWVSDFVYLVGEYSGF